MRPGKICSSVSAREPDNAVEANAAPAVLIKSRLINGCSLRDDAFDGENAPIQPMGTIAAGRPTKHGHSDSKGGENLLIINWLGRNCWGHRRRDRRHKARSQNS